MIRWGVLAVLTALTPVPAHAVSIAVVKTQTPAGDPGPGGPITYRIDVTNASATVITSLCVIDTLSPVITGVLTDLPNGFSQVVTTVASGTRFEFCGSGLSMGPGVTWSFTLYGSVGLVCAWTHVGNTAYVTASGAATSGTRFSNGTGFDIQAPVLAISVNQTVSLPGGAVPGQPVRYRIDVSNTGSATITEVRVTDTVSPIVTGVVTEQPPSFPTPVVTSVTSGTRYDWSAFGPLWPGTTFSFTITGTLGVGSGAVSNTAFVVAATMCAAVSTQTSPVGFVLASGPPMAVTVYMTPATPSFGQPMTYTIIVSNLGTQTLFNIKVIDPLPALFQRTGIVTWSPMMPGTGQAGNIELSWANMPPGYTRTITIPGQMIPACAPLVVSNQVTFEAVLGSATLTMVSDPALFTRTSTGLDVVVTKTLLMSATAMESGGPVAYRITVANTCGQTVTSLTVVDTLPSAITGVTTAQPAVLGAPVVTTVSGTGGRYVWTGGPLILSPGASYSITITGTLGQVGSPAWTTNIAAVIARSATDTLSKNSPAAGFWLNPPLSMYSGLWASPDPVFAGDLVTVVLTVTNVGGVDLRGFSATLYVSGSGCGDTAYPPQDICATGGGWSGMSYWTTTYFGSGPVPALPATLLNGESRSFTWMLPSYGCFGVDYMACISGTRSDTGTRITQVPLEGVDFKRYKASLAATPNPGIAGESVTVTLTVTHAGYSATLYSPVLLVDAGGGLVGPAVGPAPASVLLPQGLAAASFSWTMTALGTGTVQFSASVAGFEMYNGYGGLPPPWPYPVPVFVAASTTLAIGPPIVKAGPPLPLTTMTVPYAIEVAWGAAAPGDFAISGYEIFRATCAACAGIMIAVEPSGATVWSDWTAGVFGEYWYTVRAVDTMGYVGATAGPVSGRVGAAAPVGTKRLLTPNPSPGGPVVYAIDITNRGTYETEYLVVTDTVPSGITVTGTDQPFALSPPSQSPVAGGTLITWFGWPAGLAPGQTFTLTITGTASVSATSLTVCNEAWVEGFEFTYSTGWYAWTNNVCFTLTGAGINCTPAFEVRMTATPSQAGRNDIIEYRISFSNTADCSAWSVHVTTLESSFVGRIRNALPIGPVWVSGTLAPVALAAWATSLGGPWSTAPSAGMTDPLYLRWILQPVGMHRTGYIRYQAQVVPGACSLQSSGVSVTAWSGFPNYLASVPVFASVTNTGNCVPSIPLGLTAIGGTGFIVLSWQPSWPGSNSISEYEIFRATCGTCPASLLASSTATTYSDVAIVGGQPYTYTVRAVDATGVAGGFSTPVTASAAVVVVPPPAFLWATGYNGSANGFDVAYGCAVDGCGNLTAVGPVSESGQGMNWLVRSWAPDGATRWSATHNDPANSDDEAYAVVADASGNVIVAGYENRPDLGQGLNWLVRKFSSAGAVLWSRTYNGPANTNEIPFDVAVDAADNIYVVGETATGAINLDWMIRKYDPAGNLLMAVTWAGAGGGYDSAAGIAVDPSGSLYVGGDYYAGGTQAQNGILQKRSADGTLLWSRTWGSSTVNGVDYSNEVALDAAGNVYLAGFEDRTDLGQSHNWRLGSYDAAGNLRWVRTHNGGANGIDRMTGVAVDATGLVIASGFENRADLGQSANWLVRAWDTNGTLQWSLTYNGVLNGSDEAHDVVATDWGGLYVSGLQSVSGQAQNWLVRQYGSASAPACGTPPAAPATLAAQGFAASARIELGWTPAAPGSAAISGYEIFRATCGACPSSVLAAVGPAVTVFTDLAVTTGLAYTYTIRAVDVTGVAGGFSPPATASVPGSSITPPSFLWATAWNGAANGGDIAWDAVVDACGNLTVAGTQAVAGQSGNWLVRSWAADGTTRWTATHNGPSNGSDDAFAAAVDSMGNVIVAGYETRGDLGQGMNWLVRKYDANGSVLWSRTYNGPANTNEMPIDVTVDGSDNIFAVGQSATGGANLDWMIRKYDAAGNELLTVIWAGVAGGHDSASGIAVDPSGSWYVSGDTNAAGTEQTNWMVQKRSAAGTLLWSRTYGTPGLNSDDRACQLGIDAAGNITVAGAEERVDLGQQHNWRVISYDADGNVRWTASHNGAANGRDKATALTVEATGRVIAAGYEYRGDLGQSDNWLIRAWDANGVVQWSLTFNGATNGADEAHEVVATDWGGLYVVGLEGVPGQAQNWRIQRYGSASVPACGTPPAAPATLTALGLAGPDRIELGWSAAVPGSNPLSAYEIFRTTCGPCPAALIAVVSAGVTAYTDAAVVPGVTYTYTVRAVDSAGLAGLFSPPSTVSVPSAGPSPAWTTGTVPACAPGLVWTRTAVAVRGMVFNDLSPLGTAVDDAGHWFLAGEHSLGDPDSHWRVRKYDESGNEIWTWDGPVVSSMNDVRALTVDGSGDVIIGGWDTDGGGTLRKLDGAGGLLWTVTTSGGVRAAAADGAGRVFVGETLMEGFRLSLYDAAGEVMWSRTGGASGSAIYGLAVDAAGGVLTAGGLYPEAMVERYAPDGTLVWSQTLPGIAHAVATGPAGDAVVAGIAEDANVAWQIWRLDAAGAVAWADTYAPAPASFNDVAMGVRLDAAGNAVVVGASGEVAFQTFLLVRTWAPDGTLLWSRTLGRGSAMGVDVDALGRIGVVGSIQDGKLGLLVTDTLCATAFSELPPSAPSTLTAQGLVGPDRIELRWAAAVPGSNPLSAYEIFRSTCGTCPAALLAVVPAAATSYADSAVPTGVPYTYTVRAVDDTGLTGPFGPPATLFVPAAPGLQADIVFLPDPPAQGTTFSIQVTVSNTGNTVLGVANEAPQYGRFGPGESLVVSNNTFCTFPVHTLLPGQSIALCVVGYSAPGCGPVTFSLTLTGWINGGPSTVSQLVTATTFIAGPCSGPGIFLDVRKDFTVTPTAGGDPVGWRIVATNTGTTTITSVIIVDTLTPKVNAPVFELPAGFSLDSVVSVASGTRYVWSATGLALVPGQSLSLTVNGVAACEGGVVVNRAHMIATDGTDSIARTNLLPPSAFFLPVNASFATFSSVSPSETPPGGLVVYQSIVTNTSSRTLTDVEMANAIPALVRVVATEQPAGYPVPATWYGAGATQYFWSGGPALAPGDSFTFTVTGLAEPAPVGTAVADSATVTARSGCWWGIALTPLVAFSVTAGGVTPPSACSGLTVLILTGGDLLVNWTPSAPGDYAISAYEIWRSTCATCLPALLATTGATMYVDGPGVPGGFSQYQVRAVDVYGFPGSFGTPVSVTLPGDQSPPAPGWLTVIPGPGVVRLEWSRPDPCVCVISAYRIWRGTCSGCPKALHTVVGGSVTIWQDGGLDGTITYEYEVEPVNTWGTIGTPTNPGTATPVVPPPATLVVTPRPEAVQLEWGAFDPCTCSISAYQIWRATCGGCPKTVHIIVGPSVTIWLDSGLTAGEPYEYEVRVIDGDGNVSPPSPGGGTIAGPPDFLIGVTKDMTPAVGVVGAPISYRIVVRNLGSIPVDELTVWDTVPPQVTGVATVAPGSFGAPVISQAAPSGTLYVWTATGLGLTQGATITITVTGIAGPLAGPATVCNVAGAWGRNGPDEDIGFTAPVCFTATPSAQLTGGGEIIVGPVPSATLVATGDWITVSYTVTNTGTCRADVIIPTLTITGTCSPYLEIIYLPGVCPKLEPGESFTFFWTYSVSGTGTLDWLIGSRGTEGWSGLTVMPPPVTPPGTNAGKQCTSKTSVTITPGVCRKNKRCRVVCRVVNLGDYACDGSTATLFIGGDTFIIPGIEGPDITGPIRIEPGTSTEFVWTFTPTGTGDLCITADAAGFGLYGSPVSGTTVFCIAVVEEPAISVVKEQVTSGSIGSPLLYRIIVSNTGGVTLTDLIVVDTVSPVIVNVTTDRPAGFASAIATDTASGTRYAWTGTGLTFLPGTAYTFTITGSVGPVCTALSVSNTAYAAAFDPEEFVDGASNPVSFDVLPPVPGLAVTLVQSPPAPSTGDPVTYTITLENTGTATLTTVIVTDTVAPQITVPVGNAPAGFAAPVVVGGPSATRFTWTSAAPFPPGAVVVFTITGVAGPVCAPAQVSNTAWVSAADACSATAMATNPAGFDLVAPVTGVSFVLTQTPAFPSPGGPVTYVMVVTNTGTATVTSLTITDTLSTAIVGVTSSQPSPFGPATIAGAPGGSRYEWSQAGLAFGPGATYTFTLTGTASVVCAAAELSTTAVLSAGTACGTTTLASNPAGFPLPGPVFGALLVKTQIPAAPGIGAFVAYEIHFTNTGTAALDSIVIVDTVPAVVVNLITRQPAVLGAPAVTSVAAGTRFVWSAAGINLLPGATLSVTVTGRMGLVCAPTMVSNTAYAAGFTGCGMAEAFDAPAGTVVLPPVTSIAASQRQTPAAPTAGGPVAYLITVRNTGTATISDLSVVDTVPLGVFVTGTDQPAGFSVTSGAAPAGTRFEWTGAAVVLTPGARFTFTITGIAPDACVSLSVTHTAVVTGAGACTVSATVTNGAGFTLTGVTLAAAVSLQAVPAEPATGASVTYRILVVNTGTATITDLLVSDTIPALVGGLATAQPAGFGAPVITTVSGGRRIVWVASGLTCAPGTVYTLSVTGTVGTVTSDTTLANRAVATAGIACAQAGAASLEVSSVVRAPVIPPEPVESGKVKIVGGIRGYINPKRGEQATILIRPETAGEIVVRIYDQEGVLVWTESLMTTGGHTEVVQWRGVDSAGREMPPGLYPILITAPGIRYRDTLIVVR